MTERSPETLYFQSIMQPQLELLRTNLARGAYPHFPAFYDRLFLQPGDDIAIRVAAQGPWQIDSHPKNTHAETTPTLQMQQELLDQGLRLDSMGRPLHPWIEAMATDPSIGIVTGKGAYWHWGPNYTADTILLSNNHVLLIKRGDNGMWALPGGHVDSSEDPLIAAKRELHEETGLDLPVHDGLVVYRGPVVDPRVTANAWPETTAVLYRLADFLPDVEGLDDAQDAAWFPLDVVRRGDVLFGSHRFLLDIALRARSR